MHRLSRRSSSLSDILRYGGALRRLTLSSASVGERTDINSRCYSSLLNSHKSSGQPNWKRDVFLGKRYESTAAESSDSGSPLVERFEYQPEERHLIDLISSYSNKELFVRELLSNAGDALNKLQVLSYTEPELLKDNLDCHILIKTDQDNGIITITDTGIGMTKKELVDYVGTIAQSRTETFLKALKDGKDAGGDNNIIGQFGVGYFSAFLVSDRVVISTKSPKSEKRYVWEGETNTGSYTIYEEPSPEELLPRGTRLTLYLKRDYKGFAHPEQIETLIRRYSKFVTYRVFMWREEACTLKVVDEDRAESKKDEQDEKAETKKKSITRYIKYWDTTLDNREPFWFFRNPRFVNDEVYKGFYKNAFNEYLEPLAMSANITEEGMYGEKQMISILYVPASAPSGKDDMITPKTKNIKLYVKRICVSDYFYVELFPKYLSFVKGMVESDDLNPVTMSREIHQESRILTKWGTPLLHFIDGAHMVQYMRKHLVRITFDMILEISMRDDRKDYERFWDNFGKHLKLGCIEDPENHERIAPLLRFFSSQSEDKLISLDEYVKNMKPDQKDIYYIAADSVSSAKNTPFLEKLVEKDLEVLFFVDPIDEVAIQNLQSYKENNFVDISKEDLDLGYMNEEREKEAVEAKVV